MKKTVKRILKTGLALGGGAARGQAHVGVLKVFAEEHIIIDLVAGTSAGSLVGALFCTGHGWREIAEMTFNIKWGDMLSFGFRKLGFFKTDKLEKLLDRTIGSKCFEETELPFRVVAVDIITGEEVVLDKGPIAPAVRASCSVPGVFEPVAWGDRLLVDGGIVNSVPADVARDMGADYVIGVNLNGDRLLQKKPRNLRDVIHASLQISVSNNTQKAYQNADLMITPDMRRFSYHNLKDGEEKARAGETAARQLVGKIKADLFRGGKDHGGIAAGH